jgi:hypothetical protein
MLSPQLTAQFAAEPPLPGTVSPVLALRRPENDQFDSRQELTRGESSYTWSHVWPGAIRGSIWQRTPLTDSKLMKL